MAHYDIFRQQLAVKYPAYGHALWEPSPGDHYPTVQVGDVGFIREGKFHRLFNALLPADHPSHQRFGVPEHHEPLQVNISQHIDTGILSPNNFRSVDVQDESVRGVFSTPDSDQVSFSCPNAGAILSLPVPARRHDTLARGDFGKWMTMHINLWFAFTRRLGLGITRMEDIVLVTGCHLARSYANIAFSDGRREERVSFRVQVPADLNGVEWRFPLEDVQGVALNVGPNGQNLPEDQCIFIRGFRATRLLIILKRLRGAARPNQSSNEDEFDPSIHLITAPATANIKDHLDVLLEYIATQAPDCDMALVHDDDLISIVDNLDEMMDYLQKSGRRVWKIQCEGTSEARIPAITVATLTEYLFGTPIAQDKTPFRGISSSREQVEIRDLHKLGGVVTSQTKDGLLRFTSTKRVPRHVVTAAKDKDQLAELQSTWPKRQVEVISDSLTSGAGPPDQNKDKVTTLQPALSEGQMDISSAILESDTEIMTQDENRSTPIDWASSEGTLLTLPGSDVGPTAQDKWRISPLHRASSKGEVEVVRALLKRGVDPSVQDEDRWTPLHYASSGGFATLARVLLQYGADVKVQDNFGLTPLKLAWSCNHSEVIRVLLEHGADTTDRDKERWM